VSFFNAVQDQVVDLTPMGVEGGGPHMLAPRLEGWLAACEIYGVSSETRARTVELARVLFEGVHERLSVDGLHRMDEASLSEPRVCDVLEDVVRG